MTLLVTSRLVGLVLAAAIGLLPIAPPEHLHESDEHGDHHAIIHRHSQLHAGLHHSRAADAALDDDDERVITLSTVFTAPPDGGRVTAPAIAGMVILEAPVVETSEPRAADVELLIHGPPRAPAPLRGPPRSPAL